MSVESLEMLDLLEIRAGFQAEVRFELILHWEVVLLSQVGTSMCNTDCWEDQLLRTLKYKMHWILWKYFSVEKDLIV